MEWIYIDKQSKANRVKISESRKSYKYNSYNFP